MRSVPPALTFSLRLPVLRRARSLRTAPSNLYLVDAGTGHVPLHGWRYAIAVGAGGAQLHGGRVAPRMAVITPVE